MSSSEHTFTYRIELEGWLEESWTDWFDGLVITHPDEDATTLHGPVRDQSCLFGLLEKIRDLGLPLISVHRIDGGK